MRVRLIASILIPFLAGISSCASPVRSLHADPGSYQDGVLSVRYDADVGTAYELTVKALADLGVRVLNAGKEETKAGIRAARVTDKAPVVIGLDWRRHETTEATIKVGANGDEAYSRTIADAIAVRVNDRLVQGDAKARPGRATTAY